MDILEHNRKAWDREVQRGNVWTRPVDPGAIDRARQGIWQVLLTPNKPVPRAWFPELSGAKVLCLASGGGQQGPIFAAAGADVTVLDNSPAQLQQDRMVAERERLHIRTVQGDMRDLSCLADASFDLVFHPVSNGFVDDVNPVWQEASRVLKPGSCLLAGVCNPLIYIFDFEEGHNHGRLVVRYRIPYSDLEQLAQPQLDKRVQEEELLEFGHSLEDQIGGQIRAGFSICGFYEDTSHGDLLDEYIPTFIATKAVKG